MNEEIKNNIIKNKYKLIYDYKVNDYINIDESNIIDPLEVVITAFKNALSIASILLSTFSLVINLDENKKINII